LYSGEALGVGAGDGVAGLSVALGVTEAGGEAAGDADAGDADVPGSGVALAGESLAGAALADEALAAWSAAGEAAFEASATGPESGCAGDMFGEHELACAITTASARA
jgi:hypothetical protein